MRSLFSRSVFTPGLLSRAAARGVLVFGIGVVAPGCVVWKDDYDVMAAKYRNEVAAHELAKADLAKRSAEIMALQNKVTSLEASLADSNQRLTQNAESMAQAEYQYGLLEEERTEATQLVEQLRAEQERLASHLKAYASDRAELSAERERLTEELHDAEMRVSALTVAQKRAQARLALVRDLSLKLQPEIDRKQVEILFDGDVVVLRLEAGKMFAAKAITKDGKRLLAATGNALREGAPKAAATKVDAKATAKTNADKTAKPTAGAATRAASTATAATETKSSEPPTRLVLSQWEKGQKLKDSSERLKLAAYELAVNGVEPTRFATERVLVGYQEAVRSVLTKPVPAGDTTVDGETPPTPPAPPPFVVGGQSLVIHLVPQ